MTLSTSSSLDIQNDKIGILGYEFNEMRQEWDAQKEHDALKTEKMQKLEAALDQQQLLLQKMQTATLRPSLDLFAKNPQDAACEAFHAYVRKGTEPTWEAKALNVSNPAEGGYLVPQGISDRIHGLLNEESFFRKIAHSTSISREC